MAKDHYIPAVLIGRFSLDSTERMRERRVWVYRPGQPSVFRERAENIGYINKYYRLSAQQNDRLVEDAWTDYEQELTIALDQLSDPAVNSVDGLLWLRVLVPFVAGIFARSPDFARKYEGPPGEQAALQRLFDSMEVSRADNTNMARIVALIRSLAPIMAARWTILHTTGFEFLLNNDSGYVNSAPIYNRSSLGWAIPIGSKCALHLTPCPDGHSRRVMFYGGKEIGWRSFIDHAQLKPNNYLRFNAAVSDTAGKYLIGPTRESVERHIHYMGEDADTTFNPQMWTSHRMQIVHEFEWYRLVRALQYAPEEDVDDRFSLDLTSLGDGWKPPIFLVPTNLPEFTTGLKLHGRIIELAMSEVPGFTDYSSKEFPWEENTSI